MPKPPALMPLNEADYEAIEAAVMETNRGRWFLAEYAKRNRTADTTMLLTAIDRIEAAIRGERQGEAVDRIRFDLIEMAKAIARTKAEIASIKPDAEHHGKFGEATEELDSIVGAAETATSNILAAAEQIQEIAWTLREQGLEADVCDVVDARAIDIYTACSFQDLTGQRTRKVIQAMRYLEGRINAMIDIWGLDSAMAAEAAETAKARDGEASLLNGPAGAGHGLDQADVDVVMGPAAAAQTGAQATQAGPADPDGPLIDVVAEPPVQAAEPEIAPPASRHPAGHAAHRRPLGESHGPTLATVEPEPMSAKPVPARPQSSPHGVVPGRSEPRPEATSVDPVHEALAPITALSAEERIALFS